MSPRRIPRNVYLLGLLSFFNDVTADPARLAPEPMRATAIVWFYFAYGMGVLPASLIFGLVWKFFGPTPAFLLNGGITFLTVLSLAWLPSDRQRPSRSA